VISGQFREALSYLDSKTYISVAASVKLLAYFYVCVKQGALLN